MNERQRYRVWWECMDCHELQSTIVIAVESRIVDPLPRHCSKAQGPGHPFCRMQRKGRPEQCTGFWAGSRLIFAGDRVGLDKQNQGEVSWDAELGQWVVGGASLYAELQFWGPKAMIVGNSYDPIPDDEDEEPRNEE